MRFLEASRGRRRVVTMVVAAVMIAAASAAYGATRGGEPLATSAAAKSPITIAFPGAQSGFMSAYDGPLGSGMELAIQQTNAKGGVLGRKLKLAIGPDNQTNLTLVGQAAQEALSKHPNFLVTSCDAGYGGPQAEAAEKAGVLSLGCGGGTSFGFQGIGPLFFNTEAAAPTEGAVMGEFTAAHFPKTYFFTDESTAYSKGACQYAETAFTNNGGTVVGQGTFENTDSSFASQLDAFRQSGGAAQAIVVCSYLPGGANFIKAFRAGGVTLPIVGDAALGGTSWYSEVPNLGTYYDPGEVGSLDGKDLDPKKNAFDKQYKAKFGLYPQNVAAFFGYSTIQLLALGIEKAGSTSSLKVAAALDSFKNVPLLVGKTTYTARCHIPLGRTEAVLKAVGGSDEKVVQYITPKYKDVDHSVC